MAISIPYFIHGNKARDMDGAQHEIQSLMNYARDYAKNNASSGLAAPVVNSASGQPEITLWINVVSSGATSFSITVGTIDSSNHLQVIKNYQPPSGIGVTIAQSNPSQNLSLNMPNTAPTFSYNGNGGISLINGAAVPAGLNGVQTYTLTFSAKRPAQQVCGA